MLPFTVDIGDGRDTAKFFKFLDRTDSDNLLEILADPKGDGSTPVTVTRNVPVTSIGNPVSETLFLYERRYPNESISQVFNRL